MEAGFDLGSAGIKAVRRYMCPTALSGWLAIVVGRARDQLMQLYKAGVPVTVLGPRYLERRKLLRWSDQTFMRSSFFHFEEDILIPALVRHGLLPESELPANGVILCNWDDSDGNDSD
jgi:hypothetical protein